MAVVHWASRSGDGIWGGEDTPRRLVDGRISAISDLWLAGGTALFRGATDRPVAHVPDGLEVTCLLDRPDGGVVAGTSEGHVFVVEAEGDVRQIDAFETLPSRPEWHTPWGAPADVRWLSAHEDTVYAAVHVGGIAVSHDGGVTWGDTAFDLHDDVHEVLALSPTHAVAACAAGLAETADGGASWSISTAGLHATYARAVAVTGDTLLLSVSNGPSGGGSALYRRPLAGGVFERCRTGLPETLADNVDTGWLAGAPGLAAFVDGDGTAYCSFDEGRSWSEVPSGDEEPFRISEPLRVWITG